MRTRHVPATSRVECAPTSVRLIAMAYSAVALRPQDAIRAAKWIRLTKFRIAFCMIYPILDGPHFASCSRPATGRPMCGRSPSARSSLPTAGVSLHKVDLYCAISPSLLVRCNAGAFLGAWATRNSPWPPTPDNLGQFITDSPELPTLHPRREDVYQGRRIVPRRTTQSPLTAVPRTRAFPGQPWPGVSRILSGRDLYEFDVNGARFG